MRNILIYGVLILFNDAHTTTSVRQTTCSKHFSVVACPPGNICVAPKINFDGVRIECDINFSMEVRNVVTEDWSFIEDVTCRNKIIKRKSSEIRSSLRCRKKLCAIEQLFDKKDCSKTEKCAQPNETFSCPIEFDLEYKTEKNERPAKWTKTNSLSCQSNLRIDDNDLVPIKIRCKTERRCNIDYYYNERDCDDSEICSKPNFDLQCDAHSGIQANPTPQVYKNDWEDIRSVNCQENLLKVNQNGGYFEFPYGIRCVKKKLELFHEVGNCDSENSCEKPTESCNPIKCNLGWSLESKISETWEKVESAFCNSDYFKITTKGKWERKVRTAKFRCVRKKCAECVNPCTNCEDNEFHESEEWNECSTMDCGPRSLMTYNSEHELLGGKLICDTHEDRNKFIWKESISKKTIVLSHVTCENICSIDLKINKGDCDNHQCIATLHTNKVKLVCPLEYELLGSENINSPWKYLKENAKCNSRIISDAEGIKPYSIVRCQQKRNCDPSLYFDINMCENDEMCEQILPDLSCVQDLKAQYMSNIAGSEWENTPSLTCENKQLKVWKAADKTDIAPQFVRCMRKKKCDVDFYYSGKLCSEDDICTKPVLSEISLECPKGYGLQATFEPPHEILSWEPINSISCLDDSFKTKNRQTPSFIRCIQKKLSVFTKTTECDSDSECDELNNECQPMSCAEGWGIDILLPNDNIWREVSYARCDSNYFSITFLGGQKQQVQSALFRCSRLRCASCANPCPNCSKQVFFPSRQLYECAVFGCGLHGIAISEHIPKNSDYFTCFQKDDGYDEWKINESDLSVNLTGVSCQYHCTEQVPLRSFCSENDLFCETKQLSNLKANSCNQSIMMYELNHQKSEINSLVCNLTTGNWVAYNLRELSIVSINRYGNVYCAFPVCKEKIIFPDCDNCHSVQKQGHTFTCPTSYVFWKRMDDSEEWVEYGYPGQFLSCRKGEMFDKETQLEFETQYACRKQKAKSWKIDYLFVITPIFILICLCLIIVGFYIYFYVTERGIAHKIIWRKLNKKVNEKDNSTLHYAPSTSHVSSQQPSSVTNKSSALKSA